MIKDEAYKWLNDNATMYRGNNASDCMLASFIAGAKLMESKFASPNSDYAKCTSELFKYVTDNICDDGITKKEIRAILKKHFA